MTDYTTQRMPHAEISGCALVQDLLPLYLDGEVTHESHVLIADHVQRCERCSGFLAGSQSVRTQMLREQQMLKQAQSSGPSVAQVQQPVANSLRHTVWLLLTSLSWLGGLALTFVGIMSFTPLMLMIGLLMVGFGVVSMTASHQAGGFVGKALLLLTGLTGLLLIGDPILDPWAAHRHNPLTLLAGLPLLALPLWALWPGRQAQGGTPQQPASTPRGSGVAISSAFISLAMAAGLAMIALFGLWMIVAAGMTIDGQFMGVMLALIGIAGLLELNQRRGWIAEWAAPQQKRQLLAWMLIVGGIVLFLVLLGSHGARSGLVSLLVAAGLAATGWWMQRKG